MPSQSRITRSVSTRLRRFFGKEGYFSVSTGPSRRWGTVPGSKAGELEPPPGYTAPEYQVLLAHFTIGRNEEDFSVFFDPTSGESNGDSINQVDFFEHPENIAIEIQGFYHHYVGYDAFQGERDLQRRATLESQNIQVVFIDEQDALDDPEYYLREALMGRDHSLFAKGIA